MRKIPVITACFILLGALNSMAYTINDDYIGADPTHNAAHNDVIGEYRYYDIAGMNVGTSGSAMKVDIYTSFVSQTSSGQIWSDQTRLGDLFIGTGGWNPYGSAPYKQDNAANNNTDWDYVVVLTPHVPTSKGDPVKQGTATVYSTKDGDFVMSNIGTLNTQNYIFRADQYVQFTPDADAVALYTGTWSIKDNAFTKNLITYGDLQINFDYSDILADSSDWAFHWAMTCANDVLEGETYVPPVPEPATILLLGAGLLGLGFYGRRRMKA